MTANAQSDAAGNDLIARAETLWEIVVRVWETSFAGYNVGDGLVAIGVLALAFLVRGLFSHLVLRRLIEFADRSDNNLDGKVINALKGPIKLIPVIVGVYIAFTILDLHAQNAPINGTQLVETLVVIALFWALHNVVVPVSYLMGALRKALTPVMVDWLAKFLRILFVVIGAAAVLQIWGIPVAPVIGGICYQQPILSWEEFYFRIRRNTSSEDVYFGKEIASKVGYRDLVVGYKGINLIPRTVYREIAWVPHLYVRHRSNPEQ